MGGASETDHPREPPGRHEAEQVAQVTERLELVHFATDEQGDERGVDFAATIVAEEKPVACNQGLPTQRILRARVVDGQPAAGCVPMPVAQQRARAPRQL